MCTRVFFLLPWEVPGALAVVLTPRLAALSLIHPSLVVTCRSKVLYTQLERCPGATPEYGVSLLPGTW